jgi:uncharacterized protein (TIGR00255 family)
MKSMTGFGTSSGRAADVQLTVEVRSVNQRHLDVKLTTPREYGAWEADLRRQVAGSIARGRVEVYVGRSGGHHTKAVVLQKDAAAAYLKAWRQLKREFALAGEIDLALFQGRSEIFHSVEKAADAKQEMAVVGNLLTRALAAHAREREREGAHLQRDMRSRVRRLEQLSRTMGRRTKTLVPRLQERLEKRIRDLLGREVIEPARLAQEAAMLADRADVTEELVRLESHLGALHDLLSQAGSIGKRIDFVLQEVHREINTIGSKSADIDVTNLVLDAKAEVEKLREQVQNVE